jgi:hypothetical protein
MRLLKSTEEYVCDSEEEAKNEMENIRSGAGNGYLVGSMGYTYKTKKSKGNIADEAWVCKIVQDFGGVWEE